ncbi:hypothetical protein [Vulcanisaeta souniana]|uniref:hypothetical protein n=1 Tax=Vulcanisaeta souniana TaxID=164452 RepID=UPI00166B5EA7|nr:hypothetical protein [Vulcanisaeta souniana]
MLDWYELVIEFLREEVVDNPHYRVNIKRDGIFKFSTRDFHKWLVSRGLAMPGKVSASLRLAMYLPGALERLGLRLVARSHGAVTHYYIARWTQPQRAPQGMPHQASRGLGDRARVPRA